MITVEDVTRRYGDFTAVDHLSFTISPGEIVGLLGHNGAGKTTFMKMLTGYLEPTAGRIVVDGDDVSTNLSRVQKRLGYLPENCPLYPEMTVIDYLDYCAALRNIEEGERQRMVAKAIARTDLQEKALQPIGTLSRGYRQRTGVAQAILHEPRILILDEPTNGLDPTQIQQMRDLIKNLARHSTVIISTHILQEVQAICDRVIIISNGRMALDSRLDALQSANRLLVEVGGLKEVSSSLFAGLDQVSDVSMVVQGEGGGATRFALTPAPQADRQELAAKAAEVVFNSGCKLFGLQYEMRDLETVFAEISAQ